MKPRYKCLFLLLLIFVILEVTHCADDEVKNDISSPRPSPKNRYVVEKTQNVTEKREAVPGSVDDDFRESFRKVRKVHRKLVNKKLHQYDETEDLERKRIKDSKESPKKNMEVQHVIQKMKIVESPNNAPRKQNSGQREQTTSQPSEQKTTGGSKTRKKVISSEIITQDDSKAEDSKENVAKVLPSTETKRKSLIDSEIEREEESDSAADSPNTNQRKKMLDSPERKGRKVIRTIYVTRGKNTHSEEEHDNLEAEYLKLKESANGATPQEKETGVDTEKHTNVVETEDKDEQNKQPLSKKQKRITDFEEDKNTETEEVKPSSDSDSRTKTRRVIVRRPMKIIRKNISRTAKEEEQKENRREEQTFVDSEVSFAPVKRRKKIITTLETEKDQSKNTVEGSEHSETIIEKPEGQDRVEHITIKRRRRGKGTKRSDKSNTEDVEIITDSEEPPVESKPGTMTKRKPIKRRLITEAAENDSDTKKNRKKIINVIEKTDLDSADAEDTKQTIDTPVQTEEITEVQTEKIVKEEPSQIFETETAPSERRTKELSRIITESEDVADDKTTVKPRRVRIIKKQNERKDGAATDVIKGKSIAEVEEEVHQMLSEGSQTEKPYVDQQPGSAKQTKKTIIITKKLDGGSETHENLFKPIDTYTNIVESKDRGENEITTTEIQKHNTEAPNTRITLRKTENVEVTTTMPHIIIKDKALTVIKIPLEDTDIIKSKLAKLKRVDSKEPVTEFTNIDDPHNAVIKTLGAPGTFKHSTRITKTGNQNKISKENTKTVINRGIQTDTIQVSETDTDKKTTVVPYVIEPVKESTFTEPETQTEQISAAVETEKKVSETDEIRVIKSPIKIKKVIIQNEDEKTVYTLPETRPKITRSYEAETPASVIDDRTTGSETQKEHGVSEIEHTTKKHPDEIGSPETLENIITTMTMSEEQDATKLKSEDEKLKPIKETGETSEPNTFTVKNRNKIRYGTKKEQTEVDADTDKVEVVKDTGNVPRTNIVIVKKVSKTDLETQKEDTKTDTETEDVKSNKEIEKYPKSRIVIVKRIKKSDTETQNGDSEAGTINTEVQLIKQPGKTPESSTVIVKRLRKTDSETERADNDATNTHEAGSIKEAGLTPGSRTVTVRNLDKGESRTQKENSEVESKVSEPEEASKSSIKVVKRAKKIDSEIQNDEYKNDTKTREIKTIRKMRRTPETRTLVVRKAKTTDSETQKDEFADDTKTHEIETIKETREFPESRAVVVKAVKKIDSETELDESENTKSPEVKTAKESRTFPESSTVIVRKVRKIDSETPKEDNQADSKINEIQASNETEKSPGSDKVVVKKIRLIDSEKKKKAADISEIDSKDEVASNEERFSKDFERTSDDTTVIVKKVRKTEPELQKGDYEVDTKTNTGKPTKESGTVGIKKIKKTDSEIQKDTSDVLATKAETQSDGIRLFKDDNNIPKLKTIIVKRPRKPDTETEKEGADVSDVNTIIKKHTDDSKLNDKLEKDVESRAIIKESDIAKPETKTEDTELSDHEHLERKRTGHTEETSTIVQPETDKDHIEKRTDDAKLKDKLEKVIESRGILKNSDIAKPETKTQDTELSDNEHLERKRTGYAEEISTVVQPETDKDHIKDIEVDSKQEKQYTLSEQENKIRNLPSEAKTTQNIVMTDKTVDAAIMMEDNRKKTKDMRETKVDTATHAQILSGTEDERDVRKDKHVDKVAKTTQIISSESEENNVNAEKKQLLASGDNKSKDETVIIKDKRISSTEKTPATSSEVKTDRKTPGDEEELVEKDEVITDTQEIEEEVDEEDATSQNSETASKQGSKTVVKPGAQKLEHQPGIRPQAGILTKGSAYQVGARQAAGKVTAGRKPVCIPKPSKPMLGPMKGRVSTEFLFLLENDAESTNLKDPSVAAELMNKLKVSKTRNYTTYHVKRGKQWSTNDDLVALMQRLQATAPKIQSAREIGGPYLKNIQELQRVSTKYLQDGYQASLGTEVKLQIKQYEKLQNAYLKVETALQQESNDLLEYAIKAICEIRSGMFKMECFKEQYPVFEKFLSPAEPDKKDCYGNVRKLPEWTKAAPELWSNKERRLNKLQGSIENLKKSKQQQLPVQNVKKSIAAVICDVINYMDVQTKFLNFSTKLEGIAKLSRREINICNKKEPIDPALADADK